MKVQTTITIEHPKAEVLAYVTRVENATQWAGSILEAVKTSDGPVGMGSTCKMVSQAMGNRFTHEFEVTEFQPGERYAIRSTDGPFPLSMSYTVEDTPDGTRLHVVSEAALSGLMAMAGPAIQTMAQKQIEDDHARLKRLLESSTVD